MTSAGNQAEDSSTYNMESLPSKGADAESVQVEKPQQVEKQMAGLADLDGIKRSWNLKGLVVIWTSAILMSFALNLTNHTSNSFAPYATSSFASAPLLGTITVVQAVASSGMPEIKVSSKRYLYISC